MALSVWKRFASGETRGVPPGKNLHAVEAAYKAGLSQVSELTEAAGQLAAARSVRAGAMWRTTQPSLALWPSLWEQCGIEGELLNDILERDYLSLGEVAGRASAF